MTIRVALNHQTTYTYDRPISIGPQFVRLRPAYHGRTPIDAYSLRVDPPDHFVNWQQDPFGNPIARYLFSKPVTHLKVTVDLIADMTVIDPFDFFIEDGSDQWPFAYEPALCRQLSPYLAKDEPTELLSSWVDQFPKESGRIVDFLVAVNS